MATTGTPRRFYLHKRLEARIEFSSLEPVWQAKQEAEPGTALPADFPHLTELTALGYTTHEDLDGADESELERAGLTLRQSKIVIAAFAAL